MLGCWGSFQNPEHLRLSTTRTWPSGAARCSSRRASWSTANWSRTISSKSISASASCSGSSFYDDWQDQETFVTHDPLGNPVDPRHPWNQTTMPKPQKRDFDGKYTWVMSPRWFDRRKEHLALDTGGGPLARLWVDGAVGTVDIGGYVKATGNSVKIRLPKTRDHGGTEFRMAHPEVEQHARTRPRAHLFPGLRGGARAPFYREGAGRSSRGPTSRPGSDSRCRKKRSAAAFTRRCAACCRITW